MGSSNSQSIRRCLTICGTHLFLQKPERDEWGSGTEALECALQLEKSVNQSLLDLHKLCSDHNDPHVSSEELQSSTLAHAEPGGDVHAASLLVHLSLFAPVFLLFQLCDHLETHFLDEQVKSIKELADWVTNLRRMGAPQNGMAEYLFDKHTLGKDSS